MEFDLNCTPPEEEDISGGVDPGEDDINMQEGIDSGQDAVGVEQAVRKRKTLNDQQKYAAYVALHALCMSRGGKFKKNDKKDIA